MARRFGPTPCGIAAAALLLALTGCSAASAVANSNTTGGTVLLKGLSLTACTQSAAPLPGWKNCTGTVSLDITKTVSSGYVSVYFNYPDANSFYHGQVAVAQGAPGSVTVSVVNDYVAQCVASFPTTVDVYDGPESAQSAPSLASIKTTLNVHC